MKHLIQPAVIVMLMAAVVAVPAAAQAQDQRTTVTFTPGVATVGGDTEMALAGAIGYRFTEHLSFEGDFTWIDAAAGGVRDRQFAFDGGPVTTGVLTDVLRRTQGMFGGNGRLPSFNLRGVPGITTTTIGTINPIGAGSFRAEADGQTMIGTLGVRYEPAVQTARFRPYVSGGFGLNYTDQELTLAATTATREFDESISHSGFAFSAGGGANIRVFKSLWANADAKYFRLSRDRNIMRLGGGVGFRF
jgi:opacity protein-like surface antigen